MIADYAGSKYVSVVDNGTVSLAIAIMALGIKGEYEVIVPDYTMIASANAVTLAGDKPVLEDIEGIEFVDINLEDTSPWFIDILVGEGKRDKLASFLDKKGIGTRPFYPAIHTKPPYSWIKGDFKNSEYISERGL